MGDTSNFWKIVGRLTDIFGEYLVIGTTKLE